MMYSVCPLVPLSSRVAINQNKKNKDRSRSAGAQRIKGDDMSREIRFTVTDEEYADVLAYVKEKRRWRNISAFLRDACFKEISRNRTGSHHPTKEKGRTAAPLSVDESDGPAGPDNNPF